MAISTKSIEFLRKLKTKMRKRKLEANSYDDNMMGDQLLGHPSIIEIENNLNKG